MLNNQPVLFPYSRLYLEVLVLDTKETIKFTTDVVKAIDFSFILFIIANPLLASSVTKLIPIKGINNNNKDIYINKYYILYLLLIILCINTDYNNYSM
jgi:hypothetical protein